MKVELDVAKFNVTAKVTIELATARFNVSTNMKI